MYNTWFNYMFVELDAETIELISDMLVGSSNKRLRKQVIDCLSDSEMVTLNHLLVELTIRECGPKPYASVNEAV